ncbi:MAG: hypothetical protein JNM97_20080 [Rhodoferax sp.]|nr:hypothetical protein [Rhodoferax sp.]
MPVPPTRLDDFILRMQAQRACIDEAAVRTAQMPGPVLEVGLGNGRTFDHLRQRFTGRPIFVFDREVGAHPDCIPAQEFQRLGDFRRSLPDYLSEGRDPAVFIHADIGSANRAASTQLASELAPVWLRILAIGGFLASDQPVHAAGFQPLPMPGGVTTRHYHFYQRTG